MSIYDNIDLLLKEKNMSRRRLAREAGIKETTLAACFTRRPEHFPLRYAEAIAAVLGVTPDELYGTSRIKDRLSFNIPQWNPLLPRQYRSGITAKIAEYLNNPEQRKEDLLKAFDLLNPDGQWEAVTRVMELTEVDRFKLTSE